MSPYSELRGVRLIRIFHEQISQSIDGNFFEERRRGLAALRIHAHVERPVIFGRETTRRIVQLHRGNAKIGEN